MPVIGHLDDFLVVLHDIDGVILEWSPLVCRIPSAMNLHLCLTPSPRSPIFGPEYRVWALRLDSFDAEAKAKHLHFSAASQHPNSVYSMTWRRFWGQGVDNCHAPLASPVLSSSQADWRLIHSPRSRTPVHHRWQERSSERPCARPLRWLLHHSWYVSSAWSVGFLFRCCSALKVRQLAAAAGR